MPKYSNAALKKGQNLSIDTDSNFDLDLPAIASLSTQSSSSSTKIQEPKTEELSTPRSQMTLTTEERLKKAKLFVESADLKWENLNGAQQIGAPPPTEKGQRDIKGPPKGKGQS